MAVMVCHMCGCGLSGKPIMCNVINDVGNKQCRAYTLNMYSIFNDEKLVDG